MAYALKKTVGFILLLVTVGGVSMMSVAHLISPLFQ
jgi:hypothetical protein